MKTRLLLLLLFTAAFLALGVTGAHADGVIIPDPPICWTARRALRRPARVGSSSARPSLPRWRSSITT